MPGPAKRDASGAITFLTGIVQEVTERKSYEDRLVKALAEKEALLRELYHRSNNNMQVISAILEFQSENIGDERLSRILNDTQDRIGSIALVNRKLYEAQDLSHINLGHYIQELAAIIRQSHEPSRPRISLETELEEVWILVDTAIPCGLILNELISNVYRHAYPEGSEGVLKISLRTDPDKTIIIRVEDKGVGIPEGFDIMHSRHIGIQSIVSLCASQLRGMIQFESAAGLSCEIRFKDNIYEARV
jgi:two-component sensor histidine kinase